LGVNWHANIFVSWQGNRWRVWPVHVDFRTW
jgi:hypothetical protein